MVKKKNGYEKGKKKKRRTFKYLVFIFNKKGNYKVHLEEFKRKIMTAVKVTWEMGERKFKNNFNR